MYSPSGYNHFHFTPWIYVPLYGSSWNLLKLAAHSERQQMASFPLNTYGPSPSTLLPDHTWDALPDIC